MISFYQATYVCEDPSDYNLNFYVVSDTSTIVFGALAESSAVLSNYDFWTARIPEAIWIWDDFSYQNATTLTFKVEFAIPGLPASGILRVAFDDKLLSVTINNQITGCMFLSYIGGAEISCDVLPYLAYGINTILMVVENTGGPGGLIYLLNISVII